MAAQVDAARETRRKQVADLRLSGIVSKTEIARRLKVSRPTIVADFRAIDALWLEENRTKVDIWRMQDYHRIEALINAIWDKALDSEAKGQNFTIDRVIALLDRRAKLLGLDAPTKIDIRAKLIERAQERGLDPQRASQAADEFVRSLARA